MQSLSSLKHLKIAKNLTKSSEIKLSSVKYARSGSVPLTMRLNLSSKQIPQVPKKPILNNLFKVKASKVVGNAQFQSLVDLKGIESKVQKKQMPAKLLNFKYPSVGFKGLKKSS